MPERTASSVGILLRGWRKRRQLSQLALALDTGISARHLSFVETGRSRPSRALILSLAERLDVPVGARNALLLVGGFAPEGPRTTLSEDRRTETLRALVDRVLTTHEPCPAVCVDRHWNLIEANRAMSPILSCVAPPLRAPPANVLRLTLHPEGLASRILNFDAWRMYVLQRLRRQASASGDPVLDALHSELANYSSKTAAREAVPGASVETIAVPMQFRSPRGVLNLVSATMVFQTADEVLSDLSIETFFPLDQGTAITLSQLAEARARSASGLHPGTQER